MVKDTVTRFRSNLARAIALPPSALDQRNRNQPDGNAAPAPPKEPVTTLMGWRRHSVKAASQLFIWVGMLASCPTACAVPTPLAPQLHGSVGLPHHGVQTGAVELPRRGEGFERFRPYGKAYWAQPELIAALVEASAEMEEQMPGGAALVLGDLSARHGGRIPRHNSHRSGRDVDLLWFVTDLDGAPRRSPGFIRMGPDGLAQHWGSNEYYRLDIERQWRVIKLLLESKEIDVQWMFCSRPVEALLIDYARARGEPDEVVWRAETVLLQPADSLPHDDHIHLRISCTPATALSGCSGGGPYWEWLPDLPSIKLSEQDLLEIGQQAPLDVQPPASESASETAHNH
jgi:penicillin-insensitive murein DD-endopeptidase